MSEYSTSGIRRSQRLVQRSLPQAPQGSQSSQIPVRLQFSNFVSTGTSSNRMTSQSSDGSSSASAAASNASAPPPALAIHSARLSLRPPTFSGNSKENAASYLSSLEWYFEAHKISSDRDKISTVALTLTNSALVWFNAQHLKPQDFDGSTMTYATFCTRFKQQFLVPDSCNWRSVSDLFLMKQGNSSTEDFVNSVQAAASRFSATPENILHAVLAGLNSSIRSTVIQHEISSVADVLYWSRIAESSLAPPAAAANDDVRARLDAMEGLVDRMLSVPSQTRQCCANSSGTCMCNVHTVAQNGKQRVNNEQVISKCKFCGLSHVRSRSSCPAYGKTCRKCNLQNHFSRCCTTKPNTQS